MSEKNIVDTAINNLFQDRKIYGQSIKWAKWMSKLTLHTCLYCAQQHGKIVDISMIEDKSEINAHERCQCEYVPMRTKLAGTATNQGVVGVDVYLMKYLKLPNYYVTKEFAKSAGWVSWKGNLDDVLPTNIIGGNIYRNRDGKLPQKMDVFGMRQIYIMTEVLEAVIEYYIPMTV